jgi:hypothetical protein
MWTCKFCGTQNSGNAGFCGGCGQAQTEAALPEEIPPLIPEPETTQVPPSYDGPYAYSAAGAETPAYASAYPPPPAPPRKKRLWWVWVLAVLLLLAAAAVVCYFTVHIWEPATCLAPSTCKICGKTQGLPLGHAFVEATCTDPKTCTRCGAQEGEALGHTYAEATCTEPKTCTRCGHKEGEALGHLAPDATCTEDSVCSRCGKTVAPALGHDWQSATYDDPETCARCGETRGEVKGYVGYLDGTVSNDTVVLYSDHESHPYVLDSPVYRGLYICLGMEFDSVDGNPYGTWGVYVRELSGTWTLVTTIEIDSSLKYYWTTFDIYLDGSISFDALCLVPMIDADYSVTYSFSYDDAQEYIG